MFFALPEVEKRELLLDQRMRGYLPLYYRSYEGEERAGTSHQEGFWIGYDTALDPRRALDGPNQWPPALPQLRRAMLAYLESVEALSQRMLRLFASSNLSSSLSPGRASQPSLRAGALSMETT